MENNNLVSIIMPAYNTEKYIIETIKSVQNQTYNEWELIIVDDCSSDNTVSLVEEYILESNEKRIKLFKNKHNKGAAVSRNIALDKAKGRWIAFLDSDDLWKTDKLQKQIAFMLNNVCSFSYTRYSEIDENSKKLNKEIFGPNKINKKKMYLYCWPGCLTVMYDASKIGKIKIGNIRKNNDYAMWLRIVEKADCWLLDENLAFYRRRKNSISSISYFKLIKWHYYLFNIEIGNSKLMSTWHTFVNIIFGIYKKIRYTK